jgi:hypothetical protein
VGVGQTDGQVFMSAGNTPAAREHGRPANKCRPPGGLEARTSHPGAADAPNSRKED